MTRRGSEVHVSDRADDIRATAEDLIHEAERLKEIEEAKLSLEPGDARLAKLSAQAERVVARMVPKVAAESAIVAEQGAE